MDSDDFPEKIAIQAIVSKSLKKLEKRNEFKKLNNPRQQLINVQLKDFKNGDVHSQSLL